MNDVLIVGKKCHKLTFYVMPAIVVNVFQMV